MLCLERSRPSGMLALLHLLLLEVHKENSCTMCYVLGTHFASNTLYAIALIQTPLISFLVTLEKASDLEWLWVPWYNRYHAADPFPVMIWPHVNLVCFHYVLHKHWLLAVCCQHTVLTLQLQCTFPEPSFDSFPAN